MAKHKEKGVKQKSKTEKVFHVNKIKKSKTKAVSTNLKKLSFQSKSNTEKADANFKILQEALYGTAKTSTEKPKKLKKVHILPLGQLAQLAVVDMDSATDSFSKL